jgi:hypothetical protein
MTWPSIDETDDETTEATCLPLTHRTLEGNWTSHRTISRPIEWTTIW